MPYSYTRLFYTTFVFRKSFTKPSVQRHSSFTAAIVSSHDRSIRVKTGIFLSVENATVRVEFISDVYYAITSRASCWTHNGHVYRIFRRHADSRACDRIL